MATKATGKSASGAKKTNASKTSKKSGASAQRLPGFFDDYGGSGMTLLPDTRVKTGGKSGSSASKAKTASSAKKSGKK